MSKQADKGMTPAYGSFKTLITVANETRDEVGHVPSRIDRSYMPKLSGSAANEMIATLRFFGLVAGEKAEPTPLFEEFVMANDQGRKAALAKMVRQSYSFLLDAPGFNIERATAQQVHEIFRAQGVNGSTLTRAVSLFLAAAKEAGITVSPSVKPPKTNNGARGKKERKVESPAGVAKNGEDEGTRDPLPPPPGVHRFELPIPGKPSVQVLVPESLDADDWEMLSQMFGIYIARWKRYSTSAAQSSREEDD